MGKELIDGLELNRIYQRDVIDGLKMIPDNSVDLIIADPPYPIEAGGTGTGGIFSSNGRKLFNYMTADKYIPEINRVLSSSGHVYVYTNDKNMYDILHNAKENNLILMNIITLNKRYKNTFKWFMKQTEFVLLFRNKEGKVKYCNNNSISNLIDVDFPRGKNRVHPSEKSVELAEIFIKQSSDENDVVLIPFCGSGSECVASLKNNRKFISFELESGYIKLANQRVESTYNEIDDNKLLDK